jgi:hypothetical protein
LGSVVRTLDRIDRADMGRSVLRPYKCRFKTAFRKSPPKKCRTSR